MQSPTTTEAGEALLFDFFADLGDTNTPESYALACDYYFAGEMTFSEFLKEFEIDIDYDLDTEIMYNLAENVIEARGSGKLIGITETTIVFCNFF